MQGHTVTPITTQAKNMLTQSYPFTYLVMLRHKSTAQLLPSASVSEHVYSHGLPSSSSFSISNRKAIGTSFLQHNKISHQEIELSSAFQLFCATKIPIIFSHFS